jgi:tRNA threonylcarbamoyladenosine biosynthesis protein TsaE
MTVVRFRLGSDSPRDTLEIGRLLGESLADGDVVALAGDLGAGKTLFCKGIARGLGIDPAGVTSPTFTIVCEHAGGRLPFHHVDAWRIATPGEAISAGLEDIIGIGGVSAVEWPENVAKLLPNGCLRVTFLISGTGSRILSFEIPENPGYRNFIEQCKRYLTGG